MGPGRLRGGLVMYRLLLCQALIGKLGCLAVDNSRRLPTVEPLDSDVVLLQVSWKGWQELVIIVQYMRRGGLIAELLQQWKVGRHHE